MKTTKKQLKDIKEIEKKVAKVCDAKKGGVVFDEVTGIPYVESEIKPKKTVEVTRNDDGVIINKETGKPHFDELFKNLQDELSTKELVISLSFGYKAPKISKQLKAQGLKFNKELIDDAELMRTHILALGSVKILKGKEMLKAFTRLNNHIGKSVADSYCEGDEVAVLVKK